MPPSFSCRVIPIQTKFYQDKRKIMETKTPDGLLIGVLKDPIDIRDFEYTASQSPVMLPKNIDLTSFVGEIENQLDTGSCVANSAVSALELIMHSKNIMVDLSRLFVYWNVREPYPELKGQDRGSYLRDGFKVINQLGVCNESDWEFTRENLNTKPSPEVYKKALSNKVLEYRRIYYKDVNAVKDALSKGYPVIISTAIGQTFMNLKGPWRQQQYGPINTWSNKLSGYHAMTIVGYDDSVNAFVVENSWSNQWGDNGLGKYPYLNLVRDGIDVWVCTKFEYQKTEIQPEPKPEPEVLTTEQFTKEEVTILKKVISLYQTLVSFFTRN